MGSGSNQPWYMSSESLTGKVMQCDASVMVFMEYEFRKEIGMGKQCDTRMRRCGDAAVNMNFELLCTA